MKLAQCELHPVMEKKKRGRDVKVSSLQSGLPTAVFPECPVL